MKKNVGEIDKNIRLVLGVIIIALGIYFESWFGVIGIIPILTATINWCPIYAPFGLSTCSIKKDS